MTDRVKTDGWFVATVPTYAKSNITTEAEIKAFDKRVGIKNLDADKEPCHVTPRKEHKAKALKSKCKVSNRRAALLARLKKGERVTADRNTPNSMSSDINNIRSARLFEVIMLQNPRNPDIKHYIKKTVCELQTRERLYDNAMSDHLVEQVERMLRTGAIINERSTRPELSRKMLRDCVLKLIDGGMVVYQVRASREAVGWVMPVESNGFLGGEPAPKPKPRRKYDHDAVSIKKP